MINSSEFEIKSNQSFLFDTNIWLYLFCPIGSYNSSVQAKTSKFYEKLLHSLNNEIVVTNAILSEFTNSFLRLDFNLWKDTEKNYGADFKRDFFKTNRAIETRALIKSIVEGKILPQSQRYPDSFNSINISAIFNMYNIFDYNDAYFYSLCKTNRWNFVSNDTDFDKLSDVITIKP